MNRVAEKLDAAEEGAGVVQLDDSAVFLAVNLLVVPHRDRDGVLRAEQQIVVDVPLRIESVLARLRRVTLPGSIDVDPDKRIRKSEKISFCQRARAEDGDPDFLVAPDGHDGSG